MINNTQKWWVGYLNLLHVPWGKYNDDRSIMMKIIAELLTNCTQKRNTKRIKTSVEIQDVSNHQNRAHLPPK